MQRETLPIIGEGDRSNILLMSGDGVFFTTQGEGATMGLPAVFARTNQCNLDCGWCDTPYTWNRDHPGYGERRSWTVDYTRARIIDEAQGRCRRVVLTGGEPLLQQTALANLVCDGGLEDWDVEVETNGTVVPHTLRDRKKLQINCSPKLASSGVERQRRIRPDVLRALVADFRTYFKFVVGGAAELDEIDADYVPLLSGVSGDRIFVSPEGRTVERLDEVRAAVKDGVAARGWMLGDRQHIRLYGDKRRT